jgi:MFS family permease
MIGFGVYGDLVGRKKAFLPTLLLILVSSVGGLFAGNTYSGTIVAPSPPQLRMSAHFRPIPTLCRNEHRMHPGAVAQIVIMSLVIIVIVLGLCLDMQA